jgi:hypothetical protein
MGRLQKRAADAAPYHIVLDAVALNRAGKLDAGLERVLARRSVVQLRLLGFQPLGPTVSWSRILSVRQLELLALLLDRHPRALAAVVELRIHTCKLGQSFDCGEFVWLQGSGGRGHDAVASSPACRPTLSSAGLLSRFSHLTHLRLHGFSSALLGGAPRSLTDVFIQLPGAWLADRYHSLAVEQYRVRRAALPLNAGGLADRQPQQTPHAASPQSADLGRLDFAAAADAAVVAALAERDPAQAEQHLETLRTTFQLALDAQDRRRSLSTIICSQVRPAVHA